MLGLPKIEAMWELNWGVPKNFEGNWEICYWIWGIRGEFNKQDNVEVAQNLEAV